MHVQHVNYLCIRITVLHVCLAVIARVSGLWWPRAAYNNPLSAYLLKNHMHVCPACGSRVRPIMPLSPRICLAFMVNVGIAQTICMCSMWITVCIRITVLHVCLACDSPCVRLVVAACGLQYPSLRVSLQKSWSM